MIWIILALTIGRSVSAQEMEALPSPSASPQNGADIDLIRARQQALEAELADQRALIETLRHTAALPAASAAPATGNLAVDPRAVRPDDPELAAPLAGYSDRNFFLRDRHSWFVLVPKGRVQVDYFNFLSRPALPAGIVAGSAADPRVPLRDTIFIKRARLGIAGTIARGIDFRVENDFASQPGPGQYGTLADASVVINYTSWIRLEAGQFYTPLTLENATSENFTDFMEKSATVRFVAPSARDIGGMLFGDLPRGFGRWYFGLFNGEGQNAKNLDNQPAVVSRAFIAPLTLLPHRPSWTDEIWVGGSVWWQPGKKSRWVGRTVGHRRHRGRSVDGHHAGRLHRLQSCLCRWHQRRQRRHPRAPGARRHDLQICRRAQCAHLDALWCARRVCPSSD